MPKQQPREKQEISTVAFPRDLWQMLCVIAAQRGITRTEAIARYAGPTIRREYGKVMNPAKVGA